MVWHRQHDGADENPALMSMARTQREADLLLGIHTALQLYCAKHTTNGYLPELIVRRHLRGALLEKFVARGLLHIPGQMCECMKGIGWPDGMAFYAHDYLRYNPTQDEYDVDRAKKAELKDRQLHAAVRRRDRDLCRYCGELTKWADRVGGRGLVFDHVDPALANGAANLVVACRSCNSRKNRRTPEAAGMDLLPAPADEPSTESVTRPVPAFPTGDDAGWSASGPQLPASGPDNAHFPGAAAPTSRSTTPHTNRPINGSTNAPTNGSTNRSTSGPTTSRAGTGRDGTGRAQAGSAGPDGERDPVGPAPPRRSSTDPDPYRRREVTGPHPADHAGLPRGPPADPAPCAGTTP